MDATDVLLICYFRLMLAPSLALLSVSAVLALSCMTHVLKIQHLVEHLNFKHLTTHVYGSKGMSKLQFAAPNLAVHYGK